MVDVHLDAIAAFSAAVRVDLGRGPVVSPVALYPSLWPWSLFPEITVKRNSDTYC